MNWADVDAGAQRGLAITGQTGNGTWQYSTDGTTWAGFGAVSATKALLITSSSQVRYMPGGDNGETATFTFRAWDQTSDAASTNATVSYVSPGAGGGTTAFSSQSSTAWITVTAVSESLIIDTLQSSTTIETPAKPQETVTVSGTFREEGIVTTVNGLVTWGDGTSSSLSIDRGNSTFTASHAYASGGYFEITATLEAGPVRGSADTSAAITGVRLSDDGELQIIGSSGKDIVDITSLNSGSTLRVRTEFDVPVNLLADLNGDGLVDAADAGILFSNWDTSGPEGDLNSDGIVDAADAGIMFAEWTVDSGTIDTFNTDDVDHILIVLNAGDDRVTLADDVTIPAVIDAGAGEDTVITGAGRQVLIGGLGADELAAGDGEDLLIAGTVAFDDHVTALRLILADWDSGLDYAMRVVQLRNGIGTSTAGTGVRLQTATATATVFDDGSVDRLVGQQALDWFFAERDGQDGDDDVVEDLMVDELVDELLRTF